MRRIALIVALLLPLVSISAQKKIWTLEECVYYAMENNINVRQKIISMQSDEITLSTSQNSRLPNLNASVSDNLNLGRATGADNIITDRTMNNLSYGVNTQTPIFTGFRIENDIKAKRFNLAASIDELEQAKNDVAISVAGLFLQVLFNKELVAVAEEQVELSKRQVEKSDLMIQGGRASMADLYESKALLAKDESNLTQAKSTLQLSLVDLAQALELTDIEGFDIEAPPLDAFASDSYTIQNVDDIFNASINFRPAIRAAKNRIESGRHQIKVAQSGYYPQLNFSAGFNAGYYYDYKENAVNPSFGDQFDRTRSGMLGLSLSIPIFNRYATRNNIRQARLQFNSYNLTLEQAHKSLLKEIQQAYYNSITSRDKFVASEKSIEASEIALQYAEEKFTAGKGTVFEYNDSKTRLYKSKSDLLQTKYEYIFRSKILDFYTGKQITL